MSLTILALDLATKTGWAVTRDGKIVESGVQDFTLRRGESHGLMFLRARRWCIDTAKTAGAGLLAYEQAHYRGGAATEVCVGMVTHAMGAAAELGIESMPIHTATLKKWAVGSGTAKKPAMITAALAKSGRAGWRLVSLVVSGGQGHHSVGAPAPPTRPAGRSWLHPTPARVLLLFYHRIPSDCFAPQIVRFFCVLFVCFVTSKSAHLSK